eukprot:CAMPEP_0185849508 /NCGR_PEP_ID=MMETSP1354-20130828/3994_1 /TAXON_ID=708628 /ORGANISM="Erythrolobus madagascarensis, Strain CCMP3276" /LENGTH=52 /DNA_ID=CAMNT_0028550051 /DNA_START=526 /DNA_END=684 /DNA_ORIENTATION=-
MAAGYKDGDCGELGCTDERDDGFVVELAQKTAGLFGMGHVEVVCRGREMACD